MGDSGMKVASQCLCEFCGKYSNPDLVAVRGGKCPFCGHPLADDGYAEPVYAIGGKSKIGYDNLMILTQKQQMLERKAAEARGDGGSSKRSSIFDDAGSGMSKRRIRKGDDDEPTEKPDFAPEPEDQKTQDEIMEAEAQKMLMDIWEQDGDEPELDEFGNPIVAGADSGGGTADGYGGDITFIDDDLDGFVDDPFETGADRDRDDPDDPDDDEDGSIEPDDVESSGMPRYVPEPDLSGEDGPWERKPGVPTPREAAILSSPYPGSLTKGFDRGPRADFRSGKDNGPGGTVTIDGMAFPKHTGLLKRLDGLGIAYENNFEAAKKFNIM